MGLRINIGKVRGEARVLSAPEPRHPSGVGLWPLFCVIESRFATQEVPIGNLGMAWKALTRGET